MPHIRQSLKPYPLEFKTQALGQSLNPYPGGTVLNMNIPRPYIQRTFYAFALRFEYADHAPGNLRLADRHPLVHE